MIKVFEEYGSYDDFLSVLENGIKNNDLTILHKAYVYYNNYEYDLEKTKKIIYRGVEIGDDNFIHYHNTFCESYENNNIMNYVNKNIMIAKKVIYCDMLKLHILLYNIGKLFTIIDKRIFRYIIYNFNFFAFDYKVLKSLFNVLNINASKNKLIVKEEWLLINDEDYLKF